MAKEFESTAVQSLDRSKSIRTTVPAPIAALLGLEFGDVLLWRVRPGTLEVTVSRSPGEKSSR
jgi:hypothetical protein